MSAVTLLVCGGRTYGLVYETQRQCWKLDQPARSFLFTTLTGLHAQCEFTKLIHGDADGADKLAEHWALVSGIATKAFPADWSLGRRAGPRRNQQMLYEGQPDLVVAFKGNDGTKNMIDIARRASVKVLTPGWKY